MGMAVCPSACTAEEEGGEELGLLPAGAVVRGGRHYIYLHRLRQKYQATQETCQYLRAAPRCASSHQQHFGDHAATRRTTWPEFRLPPGSFSAAVNICLCCSCRSSKHGDGGRRRRPVTGGWQACSLADGGIKHVAAGCGLCTFTLLLYLWPLSEKKTPLSLVAEHAL